MLVGANGSNFATKLSGYLQKADYRVVETQREREDVFKLRYRAYLRAGAIEPNDTGQFSDANDDLDNCWIFGVYIDDQLVSSIRFHIITPENRYGPSVDVFPDLVHPMLDQGMKLIDPTRFVVDHEAAEQYPEMPFLTMRAACMGYEYFNVDYVLATVRKEHTAFYRRVFKAEVLCDPREYPTLNSPICMLRANVSSFREELVKRYPIFESSLTERRMLFEKRSIRQVPFAVVEPAFAVNA